MTEAFELELRKALTEGAEGLHVASAVRRLAETDYRSSRRRVLPLPRISARTFQSNRRRLWAAIGASGTTATGAAIAAILLLSSSAGPLEVPMAYADWSATPTAPSASAIAACNRIDSWNHYTGTPKLVGKPSLTDARGEYVAAAYASGDQINVCISDGRSTNSNSGGGSFSLDALPGPDQLGSPVGGGGEARGFPGANDKQPLPKSVEAGLKANPRLKNNPALLAARERMLDEGFENHLIGHAGRDITAVTFVFAGHKTVKATVENGWYFAWWPNLNAPTSVRVTTGYGKTITSDANCRPGKDSCLFAGLNLAGVIVKCCGLGGEE
jgi:hypothetical protein